MDYLTAILTNAKPEGALEFLIWGGVLYFIVKEIRIGYESHTSSKSKAKEDVSKGILNEVEKTYTKLGTSNEFGTRLGSLEHRFNKKSEQIDTMEKDGIKTSKDLEYLQKGFTEVKDGFNDLRDEVTGSIAQYTEVMQGQMKTNRALVEELQKGKEDGN